jgi:VWFA-related protein
MQRKAFVGLGLIVVVFAAALFAQDHSLQLSPGEVRISSHAYQPRSAMLHSETRLVDVEIVVRDSRGKPVKGLSRDDFEVLDSGKKREAVAFSVETAARGENVKREQTEERVPSPASASPSVLIRPGPIYAGRSIALFFDDVNTPFGDLGRAKIAALRFIREGLSAGDRVGIFTTSAGELVRFTSDTGLLAGAVRQLQSHPRSSAAGIGACPRITPYQAYQISNGDPTALQSAVLEDCRCPGHDATQCLAFEDVPAYAISGTGSSGGNAGGGYSPSAYAIVSEVKTQASATWLQAKLISDSTFDAIRACLHSVAAMPGQHMLLIASSGFISGEVGPQEDAIIQEALRAAVVINGLDAKGLYAEAPARPLNEPSEASSPHPLSMLYETRSLGESLESQDAAIARFAESTGGLFFHNNNDLNLGFYQLGVIPEVAYQLAFPPAEDGRYHKLKIELKSKATGFVQARPGYFAPSGAAAAQLDQSDNLDHAVTGDEELNGVPAGVTLQLAKTAENKRRLSLNIYVDAKKLPFQRQKDLHVEKLTFVAALFDLQGTLISGREAEMDLALKSESYERLTNSGITGTLSLEAAPGFYSLRSVVQEGVQGKMTAETRKIHID